MTEHGQIVDTQTLDTNGSTVEVVDTLRDYEVTTRFKRYSVRIKVKNKQDETTQFLIFSDMISDKLASGDLFVRDSDPGTQPSFGIEFRRNMKDGYYIIRRYCEYVTT